MREIRTSGLMSGERKRIADAAPRLSSTLPRTLLTGWDTAEACFIVREHAKHPRLASRGTWRDCGRTDTGPVREQEIALAGFAGSWRCVELMLDAPTEDGDMTIRLWTNLPAHISAAQVAEFTADAGASKACSNAWKACCTVKSAASAIRAPRCSALPWQCWPTTFSP